MKDECPRCGSTQHQRFGELFMCDTPIEEVRIIGVERWMPDPDKPGHMTTSCLIRHSGEWVRYQDVAEMAQRLADVYVKDRIKTMEINTLTAEYHRMHKIIEGLTDGDPRHLAEIFPDEYKQT